MLRHQARGQSLAAAGILGAALLAVLAAPLGADRIVTKAGATWTGAIVDEDAGKVVLRTASGDVTIPRDSIKEMTRGPAPPPEAAPKKIVPLAVRPGRAAETLRAARTALEQGDWVKAGGLFEGLLDLDSKTFSDADRRATAAGLAACYLQVGDGPGAARAFGRRAALAVDEKEKRVLLAAAEALGQSGGARIGDKTVRSYDEAMAAAAEWKVQNLLAQAKKMSAQARQFTVAGYIERVSKNCVDKLAEADILSPNFSDAHRREVLEPMVANLMQGARRAVDLCTSEREYLNTHRYLSLYGGEVTKQWLNRIVGYMGTRQDAEDALKNLKAAAEKVKFGDLYSETEVQNLLRRLADLRFYPGGRLRIAPRPTG
jgi:hypothetical protein